ncbi:MAG: PD-(D/E)XK nuclease family protein, partial [Mariprofundaceae bacterium]|nr:PD-(D/E)XK nuclease family protein [Mariprofundaceae bacterium]
HQLLSGDARPVAAILEDTARLAELDDEARMRIGFLHQALAPCLQLAGRITLRSLLTMAWHRLAMPGLIGADASSNIEAMLNLIEEIDEGGLINFALLDERLQKLYAAPDASPEALRVELLTMHAAKGLQWDVVILPGLGYGRGRSDLPLLAFTDVPVAGGVQPLIAIRGAVRSSDAVYNLVRGVEKVRENNEMARLLYVACTRAETALHMFGHLSEESGRATKGSLLELLLPDGIDDSCFGAGINVMAPMEKEERQERSQLTRIRAVPEITDSAESPTQESESEYFWAGPEAAPVGNALHAILQQVAEQGVEKWEAADTERTVTAMRRMLVGEGLSGEMLESALKRCKAGLEKTLTSKMGTWILSGEHEDAHCEWEIWFKQDGLSKQRFIDRSFIDHDGTRWIVDYKTASHEGGNLEQFLDSEQQRHSRQLEGYRELLQKMDPKRPVRMGLYFPVVDGWREL